MMRGHDRAIRLMRVLMDMTMIVAVIVKVVVLMFVRMSMSMAVLVIVVLAVSAQRHFRSGLKIGQRWVRVVGASTGCAHLGDLHLLDFQFLT
jgi:hypothetical protein